MGTDLRTGKCMQKLGILVDIRKLCTDLSLADPFQLLFSWYILGHVMQQGRDGCFLLICAKPACQSDCRGFHTQSMTITRILELFLQPIYDLPTEFFIFFHYIYGP